MRQELNSGHGNHARASREKEGKGAKTDMGGRASRAGRGGACPWHQGPTWASGRQEAAPMRAPLGLGVAVRPTLCAGPVCAVHAQGRAVVLWARSALRGSGRHVAMSSLLVDRGDDSFVESYIVHLPSVGYIRRRPLLRGRFILCLRSS